jgi:hypothetical protein
MSHRHKERVSLSLSPEAATFVRRLRRCTKAPSMSAMFEKLIEDYRHRSEADRLNDNAVAYYDSFAANEIADASGWGELGTAGLAAIVENDEEVHREVVRPEVALGAR